MPQILVAGKEPLRRKENSLMLSLILTVREGLKLFQVISKEVWMSPWKANFDSSSNFNHNPSGTDGWVGGWMERRKGGKKGEREGAIKIRKGRKMNEHLFPTPSLNAIFILCF